MKSVALYQIVHCLDGRPRLVAGHIAVLDRASRRIFNRSFLPDVAEVTARIVDLLRSLGDGEGGPSRFVRMELSAEGELQLLDGGESLYRGYAERLVRPVGRTLRYALPLDEWASTAAEEAEALACSYVQHHGADDAVRCDAEGVCQAVGDGQLFAILDGELCSSEWPQTPHAELFVEAAAEAGMRLRIRPIRRNRITDCEELMVVDHRGITSLQECDGHYLYLSLRISHLPAIMERLVKARS